MSEKKSWGLVLSGGGAKGAYQIGVWKAMEELHMTDWIGGVSGASIGSLNGALFATGDYDNASEAWKQVNLLSVFDMDWALLDGKEGAFSRDEMLTLIRSYVDMKRLQEGIYPVFCSISQTLPGRKYLGKYERLDGRPQYDVEQLLMASSAMPLIHEAVEYRGALYRDGGLTDNVPIRPLYESGFRRIMVIGLKEEMKELESGFPEVEFNSVYPSRSLGDLLQGTLNFRPRYIEFCKRLGYRDGLQKFRAYQSGGSDALQAQEVAERELQEILSELKQAKRQAAAGQGMEIRPDNTEGNDNE